MDAQKGMPAAFQAEKTASTLLVLFVPSVDRLSKPIDQDYWVNEALTILGTLLGGATAFPQGRGVWRDDANNKVLIYDAPVIIQSYTSDEDLEKHAPMLAAFLRRMGREARQGAVGFIVDRDYCEIHDFDER